MRETAYITAVTRVRAKETALLNRADLERLLSAVTPEEVLNALSDKGYGGGGLRSAEVFSLETTRTWDFIKEIAPDFSLFFPMLVKNDFHNAKAVLKGILQDVDYSSFLMEPSVLPVKELVSAVEGRHFDSLPVWIGSALNEAYDSLTHSGDGQMSDLILDRAWLNAVSDFGRNQKDAFIRGYCTRLVESVDLRVAARAASLGKGTLFLQTAIAPCESLDRESLIQGAAESAEAVGDWMRAHGFEEAAAALKKSVSALERWCDNRLTDYVREARYVTFGIAPLYQYLESKNAEISAVRIIYTGKKAGFPEQQIRSCLRDLA